LDYLAALKRHAGQVAAALPTAWRQFLDCSSGLVGDCHRSRKSSILPQRSIAVRNCCCEENVRMQREVIDVPTNDFGSPASKRGCQFSILGILVAMMLVSFACAALSAIAQLTGIDVPQAFGIAGRQLLFQLPVAIVWLVALIFFVNRWNDHPQVSLYGMLGVGGSLVIMVFYALGATWFQATIIQSSAPGSRNSIVWIYYGLLFVLALLRATCWALVILAALGWRKSIVAPAG
jgi:hypothetical protein